MKRKHTLLSTMLVIVFLLALAAPVAAKPPQRDLIDCSSVVIGDGIVTFNNGNVQVKLRQAPATGYHLAACAGPFAMSNAFTVRARISFPNDNVEGSTGFGVQNNWFADPNGIFAVQGIWFNQVGGAGNQVFATVIMPGLGQLDSVPVAVSNPKDWHNYRIVVSEDTPGQYVAHFLVDGVEVAAIPLAAAAYQVRVELWNDNQQSGQDLMPYLVPITQAQKVRARRVIWTQQ